MLEEESEDCENFGIEQFLTGFLVMIIGIISILGIVFLAAFATMTHFG